MEDLLIHNARFEHVDFVPKFSDPDVTANGQKRASVVLKELRTLWFNTGTLCNIACHNCYIESSPRNDRLVYITTEDVRGYLGEISELNWPTEEIGFTGGEPFMNPDMIPITEMCLQRGFHVLILTNAMRPMMRKKVQDGLAALNATFPDRLTLRISLDHYLKANHDLVRGGGSFKASLAGMRWLADAGIRMTAAGRTLWGESDSQSREGYQELFERNGFAIDAWNPSEMVLFPEMDGSLDVPEITESCWSILGKSPDSVMCAKSRMVVKRKGAPGPVVVACTLLPYSPGFELGRTLAKSISPVRLNHPHCAKFCVLGGASCSA